MPINVSWDDAHPSILSLRYANPATWEEFGQVFPQVHAMAAERDRVAIVHHAKGITVPAGNPFPHFQRELRNAPPNTAIIVVITDNMLLANLVRIFTKFYKGNLKVVMDETEASALVAAHLSD